MKNILLVLGLCFAVTGCREFDATLTLSETLKPKVKKGAKQIPAGEYSAKLKIKKKEAELEVILPGSNNNSEMEFKIPKSMQLPEFSGPIKLRSSDSGQPFDLDGFVQATVTDSRRYYQQESCSEQVAERYCWHTPQGYRCETRYVTRNGWRDVEFFERTTTREMELALLNPSDKRVLGELVGDNQEVQRINVYTGRCRIY